MDTPKNSQPQQNSKSARSLKNYALKPLLQIKLGLYSILLSMCFALAVFGILYMNLAKFSDIILQLTGVEDEVKDLLNQYIAPAKYQVVITAFIYIAINIVVTILYTHKLIGPTIAFQRHVRMIAEGKFSHRTVLRKGDAFVELAEDLNKLSALLEHREKNPQSPKN
jgi:nitrogen fixation/metabolism regulation signal transduction histidine kinase